MSEHGSIVNPPAVGNPDETPIVKVSPALAGLMGRCSAASPSSWDGECGGVNGWHAADCEATR